jgi:tetratricopeptide (TPR) repeat protein
VLFRQFIPSPSCLLCVFNARLAGDLTTCPAIRVLIKNDEPGGATQKREADAVPTAVGNRNFHTVDCSTCFRLRSRAIGLDGGTGQSHSARKQHQYLEALPLLEDFSRKNPNDIPVLECLAESLLAHAATLPDQEAAGKERIRAKQLIDSAIQLGDQSQLAQNLADTMKNLAATGEMRFADQAEVDAAMKAGDAAFAKNDFDEAIKNYSHALELDPKMYTAALFVGDSYFAAKRFREAGEWYRRPRRSIRVAKRPIATTRICW